MGKSIFNEFDTILSAKVVSFNEPDFANCLILLGGSGSGKGFALNNNILLQGKHFDTDRLKNL